MEILKENICINQIIQQKNEAIVVEGDCIIPDIKPDILSVINTSGNVCIYKKEVSDGKIKIDGAIDVYIIYLADSDRNSTRGLNVTIDFTHIVNMDKVKSVMNLDSTITLQSIDCKILNGRKISIKAILDGEFKVYLNEKVDFIKEIKNISKLQILNENINMNSLLGTGTTKVYAKDTIVVDNADNIVDVAKVDTNIINRETKMSYNKILTKADMLIKMLYITDDNRLCSANVKIPMLGFIDMQNVEDNNVCDTNYEIKNIIVKPNATDEHSVYIEVEVEIKCFVYENKCFDLIQDLYSPNENIELSQRHVQIMQNRQTLKNQCSIRENRMFDGINGNQLYDVSVVPIILKENNLNNKIVYEGELQLKLVFANAENTSVDVRIEKIPFTHMLEDINLQKNTVINTRIDIMSQDFVVMPDNSVEMKVDLMFYADTSNPRNINVIDELNLQEKEVEDPYSIIVYFVKEGDSLWKIAKKFKSTVNDIAAVNDITDTNNIAVGQQLYIPQI